MPTLETFCNGFMRRISRRRRERFVLAMVDLALWLGLCWVGVKVKFWCRRMGYIIHVRLAICTTIFDSECQWCF